MKEDKFDIKTEYEKLKLRLPKFQDLDGEFEISSLGLKDKGFLLRNIRRRVNDKVIFYCKIIEGLLYPNQSNFIGMFEIKSFNEDEKKNINELYKNLMQYERESLRLDVNPTEKGDVDYINNLWKNWQNFKKEMIRVAEKMKGSWKEEDKSFKDNYFG